MVLPSCAFVITAEALYALLKVAVILVTMDLSEELRISYTGFCKPLLAPRAAKRIVKGQFRACSADLFNIKSCRGLGFGV